MSPASTTRRGRAANAPGQLNFIDFLDGLAKKAEVEDPLRPATRLFLVVCALMGLGLLVQASHAATTRGPEEFLGEVSSQMIFRLVAVTTMLVMFRIGPNRLRPFVPHLVAACGVLLVLCFIQPFAVFRNGSHRWVSLGVVSFQPSELARIAIVLWVADRCVRLGHLVFHMRRGVLPMLFLALVFFFLILVETDLGGSMLLLICVLSTMWVGGARLLPVGAVMVGVGGGAIALSTLWVPYIRERIAMFLGQVQNEQVINTFEALSSGGPLGAGYTQGAFRNDGVPYLESDYVFALVGEEWGLFGMWLVLGLYCAFLWFSLRLVLSLRDRYQALVAFGLLLSVSLQAMIHIQVVSGLAPPKGMTLPFLSDGGTSLVVSSLAVGIALGAARRGHQEL